LTSKIHMAVRGLGLPVRCLLTAGQRHDITQAKALIEGLPAQWVLGDTAFDADHFRADIAAINASAAIPSNPSRALKLPLDKDGTASGRMLLQQAETFSAHRHPLRKDREELPRHDHHCSRRPLAAMTVNRT
jgi:transposase